MFGRYNIYYLFLYGLAGIPLAILRFQEPYVKREFKQFLKYNRFTRWLTGAEVAHNPRNSRQLVAKSDPMS
jgi:hypothetical protein